MFNADAIIKETVLRVYNQHFWVGQALFFGGTSDDLLSAISGPLSEEIKLLVSVANGEVDRKTAEPMTVGEISETCQHVCEVLFTAPAGSYSYHIPDAFWKEPLGQVIAHCLLWQRGDDLITHSQAAKMLFQDTSEKSLNKLRRLIDRGILTAYIDPRESNPQKAGRVSRQDVERAK